MKLVMTSDTHDTHPTIPPGDVLIHAGDLACGDDLRSLRRDLDWLSSQPHPHKLLVCGNHDLILVRNVDRIPDSIQYLANRTVQIDGIKFHGLTWLGQPRIPQGVDVVISHKPPFSILDSPEQPGDFHLLMAVHKLHPRVCVFGHVHGAAGHLKVGSTDYYNAAGRVWTHELRPRIAPLGVDFEFSWGRLADMKTLMVVLLVSGAAWAAAADNRSPTKTCTVWAHPAMNKLLHQNAMAPIHPPGAMFDDLDEVRAVSCAADPKLTPAVRLVWAQVLQEMIERRYDRDLEEAVK